MYWRSLISGLLILVLMPAWSLAAGCGFSCRAIAGADRPANSSSPAHARHGAEAALQHHHHEYGVMNVAAEPHAARVTTSDHQHFASRACCRGTGASFFTSCVTPQGSGFEERRLAPKYNDSLDVVQSRAPAFLSIERGRNRHSSPHDQRSTICSPSPILRI